MKRCSRCKQLQERGAFSRHSANRDGLQDYCKSCARAYQQQWGQRKRAERRALKNPPAPEGFKRCRTCGEVKPHSEWDRNRSTSDGLATLCKACKAAKGRARHLMSNYGLTEAQRDEMIASQMGICVICLNAPAVHVDHCHETGRVRGVLCFNCNSAIGKLGDDPDTTRRATAYLEGNAWKPTLVAPGVYRLPS